MNAELFLILWKDPAMILLSFLLTATTIMSFPLFPDFVNLTPFSFFLVFNSIVTV